MAASQWRFRLRLPVDWCHRYFTERVRIAGGRASVIARRPRCGSCPCQEANRAEREMASVRRRFHVMVPGSTIVAIQTYLPPE